MEMAGFGVVSLLITLIAAAATLAVPVGIVVLLVILLRSGDKPRPPAGWGPDPRAVLGDRLARGEITLDEYDTAMRALGIPAAPRPGGPAGA